MMKIADVHIVGTTFADEHVVQNFFAAAKKPNFDISRLTLVRQPDNKFDANAIALSFDGKHVGHVNRVSAENITRLIERRNFEFFTVQKCRIHEREGNCGAWIDLQLI